jgi:thiamine biosynthesis lipoprotein
MNHMLEFKAMGCRMVAMLDSPTVNRPPLLDKVPAWFEAWEQSLSRFRPGSELNRLNDSAGWPVQVSETFWQVFQAALLAERASAGLVTPAVLRALVNAGYDQNFADLPREQESVPPNAWLSAGRLAEVSLDESTRSICLPADMRLDFGGVAKGWAADQAVRRLATLGPAIVSAGGDVAISGAQRDGSPWEVGVDDPFDAQACVEVLMVGQGGVASSGTDYRRWKQGGRLMHHIIDPRSGMPAQTDVLTATVIAPDAMQAEMAAKIVLISGSRDGMQWLEARPEMAGLLVLENGEQCYSRRMEQFLRRQS